MYKCERVCVCVSVCVCAVSEAESSGKKNITPISSVSQWAELNKAQKMKKREDVNKSPRAIFSLYCTYMAF